MIKYFSLALHLTTVQTHFLPATIFKNVTKRAGIQQQRLETSSIGWMNFNGDRYPDLWISPHSYNKSRTPQIYINRGGTRFVQQSQPAFQTEEIVDNHGSAWADFDNDGDHDLLISVGAQGGEGSGANRFFVNQNGTLVEQAAEKNLDYPLGRGRSPLWLDWNRDGLLDVLLVNVLRPDLSARSVLFSRSRRSFRRVNQKVGFNTNNSALFAQISDLFGDGSLDVFVPSARGKDISPHRVYETTTTPFPNIANRFPRADFVRDVAIADFNGDLVPDIFLLRSKTGAKGSTFFQGRDKTVAFADLMSAPGQEPGVSFKTDTDTQQIDFDFRVRTVVREILQPSIDEIFIGHDGKHPIEQGGFTLTALDRSNHGLYDAPSGLFIGYQPDTKHWQVLLKSNLEKKRYNITMAAKTGRIDDLRPIGFQPESIQRQNGLRPRLWLYNPAQNRYVSSSGGAALSRRNVCQSVVAGDFDNDMDIDLFLSCSHETRGLPNQLLLNQGDGTFTQVHNAGGAKANIQGPHYMELGVGSRLATADYDLDGHLDVFLGNSVFHATRKIYQGIPFQLYKNLGNANHWLLIDLIGQQSNRDGVGARVTVTTAGISQLREQNQGIHLWGQNDQRLHFGLGRHRTVDQVQIDWPSGTQQVLRNVDADQLLRIIEPE